MDRRQALLAATWRKATRSEGQGACVEIGAVPQLVGVRDSKLGPASPILSFTPTAFHAFTNGGKNGLFDC